MTISEKVAYLKGLAEGAELDSQKTKEAKIITAMIGVLEEIGLSIEDLEENAQSLGEEIEVLSDDLADLEEMIYGPDDDDEDDDSDLFGPDDDDEMTAICPNCDSEIDLDDDAFVGGEVTCPKCGTQFVLHLSEDTEEEDGDDL